MILIGSVSKKDRNYYPRVFSDECKYIVKKGKMKRHIKNKLEKSSDNSDEEIFDQESFLKC